jgi:hypothetical protein
MLGNTEGFAEGVQTSTLQPSQEVVHDFLWKGAEPGTLEPLPNIFRIRQRHGIDSIVSIEWPDNGGSPKCAFIWSSGHQRAVPWLDPQIMKLSSKILNLGCVFVGQAMVLNGPNAFDSSKTANLHDTLKVHRSSEFEPLSYFVKPTRSIVDHLEKMGIRNFAMGGFSGGGWKTTLYAAIDDRIKHSRSVAGSMPFSIERFQDEIKKPLNLSSAKGDFEQSDPEFWGKIVTYWDVYKMAGSGGRDARLLFFENESCCFPGKLARYVRQGLQQIEANVQVDVDKVTPSHQLSDQAIDWILKDLFKP